MPRRGTTVAHRTLQWLTLGLAAVCVAVTIPLAKNESATLPARLLPQKEIPWKVFEEQDVLSGATIPPDTHVIFHVPLILTQPIVREVLLGQKGETTRYWGYCFPENYDPEVQESRRGLPGQIFLSEKERAVRFEEEKKRQPTFSPLDPPTREQLQNISQPRRSRIRHQVEQFKPGFLCYVMSEAPLALGIDEDADRLNRKIELEIGTDPSIFDTDGDGITDGVEFMKGTRPLHRDSDDDGIIDGIEDKNWDGTIDPGETDPRSRDTDRDGLCDGICLVRLSGNQKIYLGEDLNLNGSFDEGETDPTDPDTDDDGLLDEYEQLRCLLENEGCPEN